MKLWGLLKLFRNPELTSENHFMYILTHNFENVLLHLFWDFELINKKYYIFFKMHQKVQKSVLLIWKRQKYNIKKNMPCLLIIVTLLRIINTFVVFNFSTCWILYMLFAISYFKVILSVLMSSQIYRMISTQLSLHIEMIEDTNKVHNVKCNAYRSVVLDPHMETVS